LTFDIDKTVQAVEQLSRKVANRFSRLKVAVKNKKLEQSVEQSETKTALVSPLILGGAVCASAAKYFYGICPAPLSSVLLIKRRY